MKKFFLYLMAALYVAAGLNHFRAPEFYRPIMPPSLPEPDLLIAISGVAEILGGLGLLWRRTRRWAAWGIIALLIAVFPANFYMFQMRDSLFSSVPSWLLIARLPLQFVLIGWAWLYTRQPE